MGDNKNDCCNKYKGTLLYYNYNNRTVTFLHLKYNEHHKNNTVMINLIIKLLLYNQCKISNMAGIKRCRLTIYNTSESSGSTYI